MKIKNIDGLSADQLQQEVNNDGKFVYYVYTISAIVLIFKRTSGVYLVRSGENAVAKGFWFTLISVLFGWWGIPWGPKHTLESIRTNLQGGKNVTDEVMSVVAGYALFEETQKKNTHQQ
jgi:hypothetical protein